MSRVAPQSRARLFGRRSASYRKCNKSYCWHMLTKSLSVVHCWRPLMYRFVFDKVSWTCGVPFGPMVVCVLLSVVLWVPLCEPVFDELLELVLLGDAAVGTRGMYWNEKRTGYATLRIPKSYAINIDSLRRQSFYHMMDTGNVISSDFSQVKFVVGKFSLW